MVLTKDGENYDLHSTTKTRVLVLRTPKTMKMTKMGGCHSSKTMVYQKRGFHNPDFWRVPISILEAETVLGVRCMQGGTNAVDKGGPLQRGTLGFFAKVYEVSQRREGCTVLTDMITI